MKSIHGNRKIDNSYKPATLTLRKMMRRRCNVNIREFRLFFFLCTKSRNITINIPLVKLLKPRVAQIKCQVKCFKSNKQRH